LLVCFVRVQILGRIVLSSTLALLFHIALVLLRVSAALIQGAYSHTEKHMHGQRMRQKIANRASSVFASSRRQGAAVERACAAACIQAKCGCSESANEQSSRAQGGSEPGRRGASREMTADQVHAAAVVGERANSGQRGRFCLHLRTPWGSAGVREMWRHRAQHRSTPVKRETVIAGLASEGLALILGSAEACSSAVVGSTPTDPVEFRKCTQDLKALSAAKEHTHEERGGGRDSGVRRPGAGRGQLPARSVSKL